MKLKTTIIASALLSLTALSAHAAQELTPEKAAALKPFDRITITGRFNAINEAVDAVSRRADKLCRFLLYPGQQQQQQRRQLARHRRPLS